MFAASLAQQLEHVAVPDTLGERHLLEFGDVGLRADRHGCFPSQKCRWPRYDQRRQAVPVISAATAHEFERALCFIWCDRSIFP
jgi:hypothetical protein